jgi:hypothetical protein
MLGMQLTERDLEILGFLLEMKFATVKDLQQKFFRKRKDGNQSTSEWYTRERMGLLYKHGLVNSVRFRFTDYKYFVATKSAFNILEGHLKTDGCYTKPLRKVDIRTFEHDSLVMKLRLKLEETEEIRHWQSERSLKRQLFAENQNLIRDYIPDGIYENQHGERVAFELELTMKSKEKYRQKVAKYHRIVARRDPNPPLSFERVRFICSSPGILEALQRESKIYYQGPESKLKFELLKDVLGEG